jgi:Tol biopolymer transport system component
LAEVRLEDGVATISALDPVEGRGEELSRISLGEMNIRSGALSPDGRTWAWIGGEEASIYLTGEVEREIGIQGLPFKEPTGLAWSPDGNGFYVTGETERGILLVYVDMQSEALVLYEIGTGVLFAPRPSPDGRYLAFGQVTHDSNAWMIEQF